MAKFPRLFRLLLFVLLFTTCTSKDPIESNQQVFTGWTGSDNPNTVPTSLNFAFANPTVGSRVDLTPFLAPIGHQGQTGTCVAWACAYYTKTANDAIIYNRNSSQLNSPTYQFSPKYLFYSIPDNKKGSGCNGTEFTYALDVMQQKGSATMATVPFSALGNCSINNVNAAWNTEASQHKIKYYRKIDFNLSSLKQQLTNKNPIIIGIRCTQNFNNWRGQGILNTSGGLTNDYHALTVVGYDDAKNAFRIANSWGTGWGDQGYIWVDYNYFFSGSFVHNQNAYIIASEEGTPNPNPPTPTTTGVDLATWVFSDFSTSFQTGFINSRTINFNLYNIGTQAATPSSNWSFYYLYYNAYNANDYGILFQDVFNTSVPVNSFNCPNGFTCNFNYSIQPGSSFAQSVFNLPSLSRGYFVPPLNGAYYLIMVADPGGAFSEQNKQNNIFYTTGQFPKIFQNGYSNRTRIDSLSFENPVTLSSEKLKISEFNSAVTSKTPNAYTSEEILAFLNYKIKTGEIRKKILEFTYPSSYNGKKVYNK